MARPRPVRDLDGDAVDMSYLNSDQSWTTPVRIPLPLPHIGSVNAWLLRGDPLTLVDTGPRDDEALAALEAGLRARRRAARGHRARAGHAPPPRPQRASPRRSPRARAPASPPTSARPPTARDYDERGEADRRFSLALMRHHGVPGAGDRRQRGLLGLHPRAVGRLRRRRRARRRRDDPRRRPRPARRGAARATARPTRCSSTSASAIAFVGDHLLARISSNTEIYPALEPDRHAPARARRVPGEPAADGRDAARPPADRARRRRHRPRRRSSAQRLADHERRCERIVDALARPASHRVRDRRRPVARRRRSPSSRCSSSGRCSGTSTCCWTPDASASR